MDKFWDWLTDEDKFVTPQMLILGMVSVATLAVALDNLIKDLITSGTKRRLALYLGALISWVALWLYKRQVLPNVRKGKIGVVIVLTTENNKDKIRLKHDFKKTLTQLLHGTHLDNLIEVVLLKNYQAERLLPHLQRYHSQLIRLRREDIPIEPILLQERHKLQKRLNGMFYVFGSVTERAAGTYFLETDVLVFHGPIETEKRQHIESAVNSIWSNRFSFQEKAEYQGFRVSAAYIYLAARYIIGEAAFAIGRADVALPLHDSLEKQLKDLVGHPNFKVIRDRLNELLAEEHSIVAFLSYLNNKDYDKASHHIAESLKHDSRKHDVLILRAIIEFSRDNNPTKALQTIYHAKNVAGPDGTWRYSAGFLLLYMGQVTKALKIYDEIENYSFEREEVILQQVYDWNTDILNRDPNRVESSYIMGFLKYKKSKNYPEALEYLQGVIAAANRNPKYDLLVKNAREYISEIEEIMELR